MHDELSPAAEADAQRHVASCAGCRDRVARAREDDAWIRGRLSALDVPPPSLAIGEVLRESRRRDSSGMWRRAAAIALVAGGAGIAWASPQVRGFVSRLMSRAASEPVASPVSPNALPESARFGSAPSGIALLPGPRFVVAFEASQPSGVIRIRLVDGPELSVTAHGAPVPLVSRQDELTVRNRGALADYEVGIPMDALLVELRVAGVRRFLKRGTDIDAGGMASDSGRYVIPLRPW